MSQPPAGQVRAGVVPAAAAVQDASGAEGAQAAKRPGASALPATGDVVLDASFVIALLRRDPAAMALAHVLPRGVMTSVTAGEVFVAVAGATGTDPQRIEGVLRALGVRIIDLPLAAAHHFPQLHALDVAWRAAQQTVSEEKVAVLSLGDLCVLGCALVAGAPVLTGNQYWAILTAHGLGAPVYLY